MPNLVQGFGQEGFEPSGGPQVMGAEEKLANMMQMMQGAPNSVLQMISRIFKGAEQRPVSIPSVNSQMAPPGGWSRLYPMPPAAQGGPMRYPGVGAGELPTPLRPTEPARIPLMNPGFIRG